MKIALTHNLQQSKAEEEAEFDTPETVAALCGLLESLGHEVHKVEVSGRVSDLVARLEALAPDLIFNTAEGRRGRFREAFYPALFDELGLPYTASDAYVCALTLDKQLTKLMVAQRGIPTPGWIFVDAEDQVTHHHLRFPLIVKPNYEGSSKGITLSSIVEDQAALEAHVAEQLPRYPSGLLVEEFIVGRDVTVPYIEGTSPDTGGVLPAAGYRFDPKVTGPRKFSIYDYSLKQELSDAVEVEIPARLEPALARRIVELSQRVIRVLGIRDVARMDYRIGEDGEPYFLEINALPSFEPGASIYLSGAAAGLRQPAQVLAAVMDAALERRGLARHHQPKAIAARRVRRVAPRPRVGLIYNLKRVAPTADGEDRDAEYDSEDTVAAIADAIEQNGCDVVRLEADATLIDELPRAGIDVAFNLAEGLAGRARESQVPALLELLGIEYTGSDPAALALTLDKALAKRIVAQAGVPTPSFHTWRSVPAKLPADLGFPLIVKPNAEGSSKGVVQASVVHDEAGLREVVGVVVGKYRQPALVESFLPGREFTLGMLGGARPTVMPPLEIVFTDPSNPNPVYSFEHKIDADKAIRYEVPANVDARLQRELTSAARRAFAALGCRDVARVDLRLDAEGRVNFIECNPLPGLTPDWSDLCMIGKAAGLSYAQLIGRILAPALRRAGLRAALLSTSTVPA